MKKKISCFVLAALLCFGFCLVGCKTNKDGYSKIVEDFFYCLNKLDFESASALLGSEDAYDSVIEAYTKDYGTELEKAESTSYIEFVYQNVSCKIIDEVEGKDSAEVTVEITAFNTDSIFIYEQNEISKYKKSDEYLKADDASKYIMLCEYIPQVYKDANKSLTPVTTTLTLTVNKTDNGYVIMPTMSLFDALSGMN